MMQPQTHTGSYYAATANEVTDFAPLLGDQTADVCVVGAGFTGISTALHLIERGYKVHVVEANKVGWGASGRNGGQVNPMLPFNTPDKLMQLVGPQYFERLTETSLDSADALFALIKQYGID